MTGAGLWIPAYKEGDQQATFSCPEIGKIIRKKRHTLYETLKLLRADIQGGVFKHVFITDDGSTDNTVDGALRFQREMRFSDSVFHILRHQYNAGKMERFFEATDHLKKLGIETMVMTDADMVHSGGDTIKTLANPSRRFQGNMLVSHQGEYMSGLPNGIRYMISDTTTSGTRSLILPRVYNILEERRKGFCGTGYGLEYFLNHEFLDRKNGSGTYVNDKSGYISGDIPLFLMPGRNKTITSQNSDVEITRWALRWNKPLVIDIGGRTLLFSLETRFMDSGEESLISGRISENNGNTLAEETLISTDGHFSQKNKAILLENIVQKLKTQGIGEISQQTQGQIRQQIDGYLSL